MGNIFQIIQIIDNIFYNRKILSKTFKKNGEVKFQLGN